MKIILLSSICTASFLLSGCVPPPQLSQTKVNDCLAIHTYNPDVDILVNTYNCFTKKRRITFISYDNVDYAFSDFFIQATLNRKTKKALFKLIVNSNSYRRLNIKTLHFGTNAQNTVFENDTTHTTVIISNSRTFQERNTFLIPETEILNIFNNSTKKWKLKFVRTDGSSAELEMKTNELKAVYKQTQWIKTQF